MKKNLVIYHNKDLDGFCSGAIVKMSLKEIGFKDIEIEMIGWDYGQPSPLPESFDGVSTIYIVDISLIDDDMIRLSNEIPNECIWIDHHKSAMIRAEEFGYSGLLGNRKVGDSASLLTWKHFNAGLEVPEVVYWVDRFDVWKKTDPEHPEFDWNTVMKMQWGMKNNLKDPGDRSQFLTWVDAIEIGCDDFVIDGETILNFIEYQNEQTSNRSFDLLFEGLLFCAINQGEVNSEVVKSVVRSYHDAILAFRFNGKKWNVSMYANEITDKPSPDLSLIAVKHGGGGHASACGFEVKNINQVLFEQEYKFIKDNLMGKKITLD